ncbi:MAG TPA: MmgE/PrpD family protein [Dehalococcoidia bacterium]|nr:MmgE/PrpD family protein [Dehalococcoidia bacterium]
MSGEIYNPLPQLIDFATKLRFEDLPASVVHDTKVRIIDSLGTAMGALDDERLRKRWRYFSDRPIAYPEGGLAYGVAQRLSLCDAAFLNSTMSRWLDYNDTYLAKEPAHPSDNIGGLMAISGSESISGKDLITAIALAYDVQCRFCEAASLRSHGWDHVNYILIGQALAGGKLLGFNHEQMYNAVALALSSHAAMRQAREGTYLSEQKNMAAADAVRGAMWALEKVLAGADGPAEIVEGKHGLVQQMSGPLATSAFDGLGSHFLLSDTYIKKYPMEYHGQTVIEHALAIREELGAPALSDIQEVVLTGYEAQLTIIGDDSKRRPSTKETADHSVYFAFAAPLLEGKMTFEQYRPEMLSNPEILGLIDRTKFVESAKWTSLYYAPQAEREFASSARVTLKDGRTARDERRVPHGHPKNPLAEADIEAKFNSMANPVLNNYESVLDSLWNIDTAKDVSKVMAGITLNLAARNG